ncbi:MocR-like pyridoxine biosynthesis transcription factor PdxR [Diaphorobacter caeni]|uniref:MocR-like pyridoxine biosynthesis transcription factor PdxR n=1 Tax=Diaphorobacter caeni TaxID=2784387 RepID=UPI00188F9DF2|nr:PLP-dependent aminotransferase family protein [Diaphorobacter caeni]MBF5004571.1 PLP-dependent aminotransferase family protein [Diaphorobacter caeni]
MAKSSVCVDWLLQKGWGTDAQQHGGRLTLVEQLCALLREGVATGALKPGTRLPATRELMRELAVSRNTVAHAYEQLGVEGYLVSHVGSGTFVAQTTPESLLRAPRAARSGRTSVAVPAQRRREVVLSQGAQQVLAHASAADRQWGAFMPGVPDVSQFPRAIYARILNRLWRHAQPEMLTYDTAGGALPLKQALVDYLRVARSVQCAPEQILITEGVHQAVDLTVRTLVDRYDAVWMEDPGYWGIANVLRMSPGVEVVGRAVDGEGITLDEQAAPPKLICVTPSHQYPLGTVMSLARRRALLAYARKHGAWILEDDYDSEFRFASRPIPAMQGLEQDAPVIYIGTFSKTLFPGLRVGYMVLPPELVTPMRRMHAELYREGHVVTQLALAELIREGHYAAHIRRMRVLYGRRREWLRTLILRYLGEDFLVETDSQAGLQLVLRLPDQSDDVQLAQTLQSRGVLGRPLSRYYRTTEPTKGLLLGYAAVPEETMQSAFFILLQTLKESGVRPSVRQGAFITTE